MLTLYGHQPMTMPQHADRYFNRHSCGPKHAVTSRAQYRLHALFLMVYLDSQELPMRLSEGRRPYAYSLGPRGAAIVAEMLDGEELHWTKGQRGVSDLFLEHHLAIQDVFVA